MAQCSQSALEFIQGAYGPMIAVLCTEDAEIVCQKNNLNFVELIRPFSQLTSEGIIKYLYELCILNIAVLKRLLLALM